MHNSKNITMWIVAALFVLAGIGAKAAMTWGPATTISGDTDVSTNGTLVVAYNVGNTNVGSVTINGVPFANSGAAGAGLSSGAEYGGFGVAAAPFNTLSANYQQMLTYACYGASPTLTLSGLTPGHTYEFQWWTDDSRQPVGGVRTTTATDTNSVTLSQHDPWAYGAVGQFATGTFVAANSSEIISLTGSAGFLINGYQLRDMTIIPQGMIFSFH